MHFPFKRTRRQILAAAGATALTTAFAQANSFPNRPITIVVPFTAGSPTDILARALSDDLATELKTPVLIENRPGGSQTIAGAYVARAKPDGYTLFFANLPAVVAPSIQTKLPYHGISGFAPVAHVVDLSTILVAAPGIAANNLQEFIALLRKDPGSYSFGSSGIASPIHLFVEMFNMEIGVKTLHVPYKGGQESLQAMMGNQISYTFTSPGVSDGARSGKLKVFGIAADQRLPDFPDIPTLAEQGLPGVSAQIVFVLVAPRETPKGVVAPLNLAVNKVVGSKAFYTKVRSLGAVSPGAPSGPADVGELIKRIEDRWNALVASRGIELE